MEFLVSGGKLMLWDATNVDHNVFKFDNNQEMLSTRNVCSLKIGKLGG